MPFIKKTNGKFTLEDKIKMFERMGGTAAIIALLMIIMIETGAAGEYLPCPLLGACTLRESENKTVLKKTIKNEP